MSARSLPVWPALGEATRRQRLPPSSLLCLELSRISDQSNKLAAAHRCEADAKLCVPVWSALGGAACRQRLAPSSLLCVKLSGISDQSSNFACGCFLVRYVCKLCTCLTGTRRRCLPTKAPNSSLLCTGAGRGVRPIEPAESSKLAPALRCEVDACCLPVWLALEELLADRGCHLPGPADDPEHGTAPRGREYHPLLRHWQVRGSYGRPVKFFKNKDLSN